MIHSQGIEDADVFSVLVEDEEKETNLEQQYQEENEIEEDTIGEMILVLG